MKEICLLIMTMRKNNTFGSIKKKNTKKAYTDGSQSMEMKVCFAAAFTAIIRRWTLLTAIKVVL